MIGIERQETIIESPVDWRIGWGWKVIEWEFVRRTILTSHATVRHGTLLILNSAALRWVRRERLIHCVGGSMWKLERKLLFFEWHMRAFIGCPRRKKIKIWLRCDSAVRRIQVSISFHP